MQTIIAIIIDAQSPGSRAGCVFRIAFFAGTLASLAWLGQ